MLLTVTLCLTSVLYVPPSMQQITYPSCKKKIIKLLIYIAES